MRRRTAFAGSGLALALAITGCQEQITDPALDPSSRALAAAAEYPEMIAPDA